MATSRKHFVGNIYKTNLDGDVVLLERIGGRATVKFLNTGFTTNVLLSNLIKGKCRDYSIETKPLTPKEYPNTVHTSNGSGDYILLEKQGKKCVVQFIETGFVKSALWDNLVQGKVRDPYYKSKYGVAYLGEFKKPTYWKQAKQLWSNMIKRCYSTKDPKGYFKLGVTTDDRWLCFANFLEDLPKLENFEFWLASKRGECEQYDLDKDYLIRGNKVYSREACMFLPSSLNKSLTSKSSKWALIND